MTVRPLLSFFTAFFFCSKRLFTGTLRRLASLRYSCHVSMAMYSFTRPSHSLNCALRVASYSAFVSRSSFANSTRNPVTSSFSSALLFLGPAPLFWRFSATKTEKPDLGGAAGALSRKRSVMTFMASFRNSVLILSPVPWNALYFGPSLKSFTSFIHCSLASFSSCSSFAFSSAWISWYFLFRASRPFPSPFPGSTSFLCSSAKSANTDFGRFGSSRRLTSLFSRVLMAWRFSRYSMYTFWRLNSLTPASCSALRRAWRSTYAACRSSGTCSHWALTRAPISLGLRDLFASVTFGRTSAR
mmetsp:Transcript_56350/g.158835  ORF Transcript_56350/g.158835 Transcript_56350/m.158835 type:complete len:300 (-) Transcript_56350:793-1692(-)